MVTNDWKIIEFTSNTIESPRKIVESSRKVVESSREIIDSTANLTASATQYSKPAISDLEHSKHYKRAQLPFIDNVKFLTMYVFSNNWSIAISI